MRTPHFSLSARGVGKSFGPNEVLKNIDLTIAPGDSVGVIAPNGTGKTTLLRILAGEEAPDQGTVAASPASTTVSYLPQRPSPEPGETLLEFLARRSGVAAAETELVASAAALG